MDLIYIDSYVKNAQIDCEKNIYEIINDSIIKPLNDKINILWKKMCLSFFMGNGDEQLIVKYSKNEKINVSDIVNIWKIPTCISISRDLAYFVIVGGKVNMSSC